MRLLHRIAALALVVLLLPRLAMADQVVLRSGKQYRGTVANRSLFKAQLGTFSVLSILPAEADSASSALVRIAREDIDYVVLEDGQQRSVFDVARIAPGANANATTPAYGASDNNTARGVAAMVFGAGLFATGALYKLGDAQLTVTQNSFTAEDKSYNGGNYLMMAGGALMVGVGIFELSKVPAPASASSGIPGTAPSGLRLACSRHF